MIEVENQITADCDYCNKKLDDEKDDIFITCNECFENKPVIDMKEMMTNVLTNHKGWKNLEGYTGFNNKEEKECYMLGIREGMFNAFFWYSEHYGDEGFRAFEELTDLFEYKKELNI